jgi:hypothetical protein
MKCRVALLALAAASFAAGTAPGAAEARHQTAAEARHQTTHASTPCHGLVRAKIGGKVLCLRPGSYCAVRYRKQYRKLHFRCIGSPPRLHPGA